MGRCRLNGESDQTAGALFPYCDRDDEHGIVEARNQVSDNAFDAGQALSLACTSRLLREPPRGRRLGAASWAAGANRNAERDRGRTLSLAMSMGPLEGGRIQAVSARSSASRSDGLISPRDLRGRLLRLRAKRARSSALCRERSVPLGMYWRSRPLMFSFDPRCQGLRGSQEVGLDAGVDAELGVAAHLSSLIPGEGSKQLLGQSGLCHRLCAFRAHPPALQP